MDKHTINFLRNYSRSMRTPLSALSVRLMKVHSTASGPKSADIDDLRSVVTAMEKCLVDLKDALETSLQTIISNITV